jgi:hypothetical protein
MGKPSPLSRWDSAVAAFLTSSRALGRAYKPEEYVLTRVRQFLASAGADDLTRPLFDAWRQSSAHLSTAHVSASNGRYTGSAVLGGEPSGNASCLIRTHSSGSSPIRCPLS